MSEPDVSWATDCQILEGGAVPLVPTTVYLGEGNIPISFLPRTLYSSFQGNYM